MQLDRRRALRLIGMAGAGAAASACGFVRGPLSADTPDLTFTTWASDAELTGFRQAIAAFEAENPGVRVDLNAVPFEQMFQNIDAQLQSGTAPDVFRVDYDNLGTYAGRGQLLDLSGLLPPAVPAAFTPAMARAVQYQDRPYGVPHHTDTSVVLYNKAALAAAGVTAVPTRLTDAWTWPQFHQVATAVARTVPAGRYPFAVNWQGQGVTRWLTWLFEAGGRFLDPTLTAPAVASDAGRAALDFTKSFFTERLVPPSSSIRSSTYASDLFFGETIGMVFAGAYLLPTAVKQAPFEWGATFAPRGLRGGSDLGGNALVATAGTAKPELAARFLEFMTRRRIMEQFCVTASLLPTRTDLVDQGIVFGKRPELSPVFVGQATTVEPDDAAQVASPSMGEINSVLTTQLERAFVGGQSTADTLDGLTAGIAAALDR